LKAEHILVRTVFCPSVAGKTECCSTRQNMSIVQASMASSQPDFQSWSI